MYKVSFNPVNVAVSLVAGWFVMSFLQSAARSLFAGSWDSLVPRFKAIAFFHDGAAVAINFALIVVLGVAGTAIWAAAGKK
jgi:hypothetical protein